MTREEILDQFKVSEEGVIKSPGKFEGEMLYAPYYYDMDSFGNEEYAEAPEDYEDPPHFTWFLVDSNDLEQFPELEGVAVVCVEEDSQGFVFLTEYHSEKSLEKAVERWHAANDIARGSPSEDE